jgi:predicted site-specific integrase-resolvase
MPKLSLREATRRFAVSRTTLNKHLAKGKVSGLRDDAGHWRIDTAELMRVYSPREAVYRSKPDQVGRLGPDQKADVGHDISTRLAVAEAALDAEREKTAMLQRHLDDVRLMLPPPGDARPRRRWWPF